MAQELTPYALFGQKPRFGINEEKLDAAYRAALLKVHPDRFAGRPAAERRVAEQWSARIGEAHALLKSPVRRAAWLCEHAGHPVEAETNTKMPADFLMEQIAWREALEGGRRDEVKALALSSREALIEKLSAAIDETQDWDAAVDAARRLMFVERFLEEVRRSEQKAERTED